jgi:hypothetical protein
MPPAVSSAFSYESDDSIGRVRGKPDGPHQKHTQTLNKNPPKNTYLTQNLFLKKFSHLQVRLTEKCLNSVKKH